MKKIPIIIIFLLLLVPGLALAQLDPDPVSAGIPGGWGWVPDPINDSECNAVDGVVNQLGCKCGHIVTGNNDAQYKIRCNQSKYICSTNSYNPWPYTICLIKIGQSPTNSNPSTACEGGTTYDRSTKTCVVDTGDTTFGGTVGSGTDDIRNTVRRFINIALGFLGVVTVVMIIYGGFLWLTANGADEKITKGKNVIIWAAVGAIIITIAWTISSYILQIGRSIG